MASSAASASVPAPVSLPDPDDGFVLSLDDPNHPTNFTKPTVDKKEGKGVTQEPQYILGTLIVRVVAAKNLEMPSHGGTGLFGMVGGGGGVGTNPYASVKFGSSTQRSSEVFGTLDPVWPRQETMFMDVSLPLSQLTHSEPQDTTSSSAAAPAPARRSSSDEDNHSGSADDPYAGYKKPNTILTVAIFHTPEMGRIHKFGGLLTGDSDDLFLGAASVDLTRLFTGKISTLDKWLPLQGVSNDSRGLVRIVCEYEPSDIPPKQGDICKFTRFCHPKDLYPLEPGRSYKVEQVTQNGEIVLLSYESQEGWVLSFQAHKNMLICEERHVSALDTAQDELQTLGERLAHSPLLATVTETAERVVDDGIVGVAEEIARGSFSLMDRWFKGGIDTVISDLQHVTNFDGRHNPDAGQRLELSSPVASSASLAVTMEEEEDEDQGAYLAEEEDDEALPFMPPCPITGFPMIEPVVAADGHTYERSAIARWLKTSDKSPMTGQVLVHKELVPNYGLMSSVQEAAAREKKMSSAIATSRTKKAPPPNETSKESTTEPSDHEMSGPVQVPDSDRKDSSSGIEDDTQNSTGA
ncbi:U-box domain containing protein [Nitzschia inconspicua]|uniref:U-box domain containing protein n=1 Tax=Nitzschia inconspicua TaxID=303405 RepID=A0A9K3Q5K2_9STRA|nr:U-box domain containing protein [Nitzschia inconspicua]